MIRHHEAIFQKKKKQCVKVQIWRAVYLHAKPQAGPRRTDKSFAFDSEAPPEYKEKVVVQKLKRSVLGKFIRRRRRTVTSSRYQSNEKKEPAKPKHSHAPRNCRRWGPVSREHARVEAWNSDKHVYRILATYQNTRQTFFKLSIGTAPLYVVYLRREEIYSRLRCNEGWRYGNPIILPKL